MRKKWIVLFSALFIIVCLITVFYKNESTDAFNEIDLNHYQQKIDKKQSFVAYIYSSTCPTCKKVSPRIKNASAKSNTPVYSLDINDKNNIDDKFFEKQNIVVVPTLIKYKSGKEKDRRIGNQEEEELVNFLQ